MPTYKEEYLEKNFDNHDFFDPECNDRRAREVNMQTKRCLICPGYEACQTFPEYWLKGQLEREAVNREL